MSNNTGHRYTREEWIFPDPVDSDELEALHTSWDISLPLAEVLWRRLGGDTSEGKIEAFLYPHFRDLHDPYLFTDMKQAAERLAAAVEAKEPVTVFGDYDVDGTTATALLVEALRTLGVPVSWRIPNRELHGYGLNKNSMALIEDCPGKLVVVLDCGIGNVDEIAELNAQGREVIVADHHEPTEQLPDAVAVIDAKREDGGYPFTGLAAVGVTFKLVQALGDVLGVPPAKLLMPALDLVALGTAADIVPMIDENRILMRLGLRRLRERPRPGLKALIKVAGQTGRKMDSSTIVFGLAPRINAAGRVGSADHAVNLFLTEDHREAQLIAQKLHKANRERQEMDQAVLRVARERAIEQLESGATALVLADEDWHPGIIGIVAARLVEEFYVPCVMISKMEPASRGSARSIEGFDVHQGLSECSDTLLGFGGHIRAAGLSVLPDNIPAFREAFHAYAARTITDDTLTKKIHFDAVASLADMTIERVRELDRIGPFGPDNMRPVFASRGVYAASAPRILKGNHLKIELEQDGAVRDAIAFKQAESAELFRGPVDIAYVVEENTWAGRTSLQLQLKAIRPAE
jgi:single-stranded-DNA-specific exonuclease